MPIVNSLWISDLQISVSNTFHSSCRSGQEISLIPRPSPAPFS